MLLAQGGAMLLHFLLALAARLIVEESRGCHRALQEELIQRWCQLVVTGLGLRDIKGFGELLDE